MHLGSRLVGLGSIFGKTLRDARVGIVAVGALLAVMALAGGWTMATTYGTAEARFELGAMSGHAADPARDVREPGQRRHAGRLHLVALRDLLRAPGRPLVDPGAVIHAGRRGAPGQPRLRARTAHSRRAIALEKVAGTWSVALAVGRRGGRGGVTGVVAAKMPGDGISLAAALSFAVGLGSALIAGSVAFALAAFLGRGAAAGIAGAVMVGGFVLHSYRTVVPAFDTLSSLTWFSWTAGHVPLAGESEWLGLASPRPASSCSRSGSRGLRGATSA